MEESKIENNESDVEDCGVPINPGGVDKKDIPVKSKVGE